MLREACDKRPSYHVSLRKDADPASLAAGRLVGPRRRGQRGTALRALGPAPPRIDPLGNERFGCDRHRSST